MEDVLSQINTENPLSEQQRQFNDSLAARCSSCSSGGSRSSESYMIDKTGNYVLTDDASSGRGIDVLNKALQYSVFMGNSLMIAGSNNNLVPIEQTNTKRGNSTKSNSTNSSRSKYNRIIKPI